MLNNFYLFSLQFTERESKRVALIKLVCNKCWINGKFILRLINVVYWVVVLIILQKKRTLFFLFQRTKILGKDGLDLSTEKTGYQHRRRTFVKIIWNPNILEKAKTTSAAVQLKNSNLYQ